MPKKSQSKKVVDSSYEKLPKALRRSTELTMLQKVLYTYMLDKYMFFSSKGQEFYESLDTLGEELGVNRTTVHRLIEIGYVKKVTRKKKGSFLECVYEVKDIYALFTQPTTSLQDSSGPYANCVRSP